MWAWYLFAKMYHAHKLFPRKTESGNLININEMLIFHTLY